ncbi:phage tail fiber protein [Rhodopseudomonas sp. RCAM05734]|uniref:phage tail fiber protein n=1 Tax=Rhodopseudomonas sp. RCAM05734 TaxID=3457549 RepID=UPI0040445861
MSGLSLYAHKIVGDQILTMGRWMSLHIADPTDFGSSANEVPTAGTNYSRFDVQGLMSPFDLSSGRSTLLGVINIGPPPAGVDWGLIVFAGFWDAQDGGNMIMSGPLQTAQDIFAGKQFRLLPGQFTIGKTP